MSNRKSWDPLDDFFDDTDTVETITKFTTKNDNNDDELDQDELLGIEIETDNFDDDFGLSDEQTIIPDLNVNIKQFEKTSKQTISEIKNQNRSIDDFKETEAENSDTFVGEEISQPTNNPVDANLPQEELEYGDLLDYGEDDDLDIGAKYKKEVEQTEDAPSSQLMLPLDSQKKIEIKQSERITIRTNEPHVEFKHSEFDKEIRLDLNKKKDEEDDMENEEEDDFETTNKRGRSNYWSERNDKIDNESDNTSHQNSNINYRNNRNYNQINQNKNRNNMNTIINSRNNEQQKGQNFNNNNINSSNYGFSINYKNSMNMMNSFNQRNNQLPSNLPNHQNPIFQSHCLNNQGILPFPLQSIQQHSIQNNSVPNRSMVQTQTSSLMNVPIKQPGNQQMNLYPKSINISPNIPNLISPLNAQDRNMNQHQIGMIKNNKPGIFHSVSFKKKTIASSNFIQNNIQRANLSPNQQRPDMNNQFNQNFNLLGFQQIDHNGLANFQNFNTNGQNGLLPNPTQTRPHQNMFFNNLTSFNNNYMPPNQSYPKQGFVGPIQQNMPFLKGNITSPVQKTAPVKPSHVYLNPSFIGNKKNTDENNSANKTTETRQNILKDANNSPKNSGEIYKISSSDSVMPKPRSKIDLNALLEKRLADELIEEEKTSHGIKRKSTENIGLKSPNKLSKKYESKIFPSDMRSEQKPAVRSNRNNVEKSKQEEQPNEKKMISKVMQVGKKNNGAKGCKLLEPKAIKEVSLVIPDTTSIIIDDPEYTKKIEEQKKKRDEFLKLKEDRRRGKVKPAELNIRTQHTPTESTSAQNKRNVVITSKTTPIAKKRLINKSPTLMNVKQLINKTLQQNNDQKTRNMVIQS